ncbi:MAG: hypothetical protein ACE5DM_00190 [Candidatus Nanoarchaeia archaeon]
MVTEPTSMKELIYFTNRDIGEGKATAWVYRGDCPKCRKGRMGKPVNEKTGKPKIRAKEYVCPECGNTVEKKEYEETLECEIKYRCPVCRHEGEITVPYKRKKFGGKDAVVFKCGKCSEKIAITKKMADPKEKK